MKKSKIARIMAESMAEVFKTAKDTSENAAISQNQAVSGNAIERSMQENHRIQERDINDLDSRFKHWRKKEKKRIKKFGQEVSYIQSDFRKMEKEIKSLKRDVRVMKKIWGELAVIHGCPTGGKKDLRKFLHYIRRLEHEALRKERGANMFALTDSDN